MCVLTATTKGNGTYLNWNFKCAKRKRVLTKLSFGQCFFDWYCIINNQSLKLVFDEKN